MTEQTSRQRLASSFTESIKAVQTRTIVGEDLEGTGEPTDTVISTPLFGRCQLFAHPAVEVPKCNVIGFVELEGNSDKLHSAMWLGQGWRKSSDQPFRQNILRWFHMEKVDAPTPDDT